ncbi:ATP-binding cassette domain-containing protein [Micromonospora sp. FIMYZ51]|uniref:ABC transporter ATP-binding protein n=1 Tax=Micromonospora sp. FIMYZ51 TaxID=3051832 RepID=UPI00311D43E9
MLELIDVSLSYNRGTASETTALDDLSLRMPDGQFITVVGSNGAGKSSLVGVVSGEIRPTGGRVLIDGVDVTGLPDYRRSGRIARVFDNPHAGTMAELSIEDNMALAMDRGRRRSLQWAVTNRRRVTMRDRLAQVQLGLENRLRDPVGLLSAGQRQSLTLVMASLCDPQILLLDEHLSALDPVTQERVLQLTVQLIATMGCTSIMVTHNMAHAISLGDRLIVMSGGRIVCDYAGSAKADLTVQSLIADIAAKGAVLSDRSTLAVREQG